MSSFYRDAHDRYGPAATKPLMPWRNSALARHTAYDHSANTVYDLHIQQAHIIGLAARQDRTTSRSAQWLLSKLSGPRFYRAQKEMTKAAATTTELFFNTGKSFASRPRQITITIIPALGQTPLMLPNQQCEKHWR